MSPNTLKPFARLCTWALLLVPLSAVGQTAPKGSPKGDAAPPPPDQLEVVKALFIPAGKGSSWHLCAADDLHWDGCDKPVDMLVFDPAGQVVLRTPCSNDSAKHKEKFKIEPSNEGVLLNLVDHGDKYIVTKPANCNAGCPGHNPCVRLSKTGGKKSDPIVAIYLYQATPAPSAATEH